MTGGFLYTGKQADFSTIEGVGGTPIGGPMGEISQFGSIFLNNDTRGEPRRDNLLLIRMLGQTPYIEWIKDLIKKQVAATQKSVRANPASDEEEISDELKRLAESATDYFDGNFNSNDDSWNDFMNAILDDVLDMDSGILELVPDERGFLKEMMIRDGATFTKNIDEKGRLPSPDSDTPAYFQFDLGTNAQHLFSADFHGIDINQLRQDLNFQGSIFSRRKQIPFSRDQIVWFSESSVSYSSYGRGRTQKLKRITEILLNGDIHRNKFFLENEFHKGFIKTLDELSQNARKDLERVFKSTRGNEYKIPIVGGTESEWVSIDPTPDKMQFLESHKWYTTLSLMIYGANEAEAGLHENANLAVSEEMKFNVWRRTTQPLLQMIERKFNNEILPFMEEYHLADGQLEFRFEPESKFLRKLEQEIETKDLELGVTTLNELRLEHGLTDFGPVGDLPKTVLDSLAQTHPGWVAEQMNEEITNTPAPQPPMLSLTDNRNDSDKEKKSPYPESYKELFNLEA